jgi:hypothetical protein
MSGGNKRVVINSLERALSTDVNNLQAFAAKIEGQSRRSLQNGRPPASSVIRVPGADAHTALLADSAVEHDCFGGLLVRPDSAGYLLVDPGVAGFLVPNYPGLTAEDTPYVTVDSPGVTDITLLTFAANAGPGVRWDVVECQPVDTLVSSESRDIFDPTTKSFSSQVVDKVRGAQLTFRIRPGVQGTGLDVAEEDWMPLAVIMVPSSATGFTECDVWDVRPLVSERALTQQRGETHASKASSLGHRTVLREAEFFGFELGGYGPNSQYLNGYYVSEFDGYTVGGDIRKSVGTAGTGTFGSSLDATGGDSDKFVPEDPQNIHPAGLPGNNQVVGIGAFFPSGYVRWVRYSQTALTAGADPNQVPATGRWPLGPRGVLVAFDLAAVTHDRNGIIQGGDHMPPQMDLPGTHWGHIVGYGARTSAGDVLVPSGGTADKQVMWRGAFQGFSAINANITAPGTPIVAGPAGTVEGEFDVTTLPSSPIPEAARALYFRTFIQVAIAGGTPEFRVTWKVGDTTAGPSVPIRGPGDGSMHSASTGTIGLEGVLRVPLLPNGSWDGSSGLSTKVGYRMFVDGGAGTLELVVGSDAKLIGYEM